jgi:hypothetical protein
MGFSLKNIIKNPVSTALGVFGGGAASGPLGMLGGGLLGSGGTGGLKDMMFGKVDPGTADRQYKLDPSLERVVEGARGQQSVATGLLGSQLGAYGKMDPAALARLATGQQEATARAGAQDVLRTAGSAIAKKGLGGSSLGLRALTGVNRDLSRQVQSIRANQPMQELQFQGQKLAGLQNASQGINQILEAPGARTTLIPGIQSSGQRSGGLLGVATPIIGGVLGGKFGGPQGIGPGMQAGYGVSQGLGGLFG